MGILRSNLNVIEIIISKRSDILCILSQKWQHLKVNKWFANTLPYKLFQSELPLPP